MKKEIIKLAVILIIIVPFLMTILFSVPNADDFSMVNSFSGNGNIFLEAVEKTWHYYLNWGGAIPYNFLQCILNPLLLFEPFGYGVGIELEVFFIVFIVTLWFYIKAINERNGIFSKDLLYGMYVIVLFCFLNSMIYTEIFYWFVGSTYLIGIIFMMINQLLIFKYIDNISSKKYYICLSIFGFISCFMYHVAVFSGVVYVLELIKNRVRKISTTVPLFFMILGGCASAFAPGNMVRRENFSGDFNIPLIFLYTIKNLFKSIIDAYSNPVLLLMMVLLIVISSIANKKSTSSVLLSFIAGVMSLLGLLFPIALGYSASTLENRLYFMVNFIIYIWSMIIAVEIGVMIKKQFVDLYNYILKSKWNIIIFALGVYIIIEFGLLPNGSFRFEETPWIKSSINIEKCYNESKYYKNLLKTIREDSANKVELNIGEYNSKTGIIKPVIISDDSEYWINKAIATWAQKESVVVEYY